MLTFPSALNHVQLPPQGLPSSKRDDPSNSSLDAKTQPTDFSQIPKIVRARFRCMTSVISCGHISIWDFYFDISEWHILPVRAWKLALMLHLTNPCAKRKVLSLTKRKGKIYKTKSLGHYITYILMESNYFESNLETTSYKTTDVQPLIQYLTHPVRYNELNWRRKDDYISDVFQWDHIRRQTGVSQKHTFISYVGTLDAARRTNQEWCFIGTERERERERERSYFMESAGFVDVRANVNAHTHTVSKYLKINNKWIKRIPPQLK